MTALPWLALGLLIGVCVTVAAFVAWRSHAAPKVRDTAHPDTKFELVRMALGEQSDPVDKGVM